MYLGPKSNKAEPLAAEVGEGRERTKENTSRSHTLSKTARARSAWGRDSGVCEKQQRKGSRRFTALLHHLNVDLLRGKLLRVKAAGGTRSRWRDVAGVCDRVGGSRVTDLHSRGARGTVSGTTLAGEFIFRRLTAGGGSQLGIASLEDEIVQRRW